MEWSFDDEEKELLDLHQSGEQLTLDHFELGPNIGRGCNAAVYAARLRDSEYSVASFRDTVEFKCFDFLTS